MSIPTNEGAFHAESQTCYTPVVAPTDRPVTLPELGIILLPCPNEGPGEQCDGCDARCLLAEFLRREGEE